MNDFKLKICASIVMLFDHFVLVFADPDSFLYIMRLLLNMFCSLFFPWLVAKGCFYTRNLKKYLINISILAIISHIPYVLVFNLYLFEDFSLLFSFSTGVLIIYLNNLIDNKCNIDNFSYKNNLFAKLAIKNPLAYKNRIKYITTISIFVICSILFDFHSIYIISMILLIYYNYHNIKKLYVYLLSFNFLLFIPTLLIPIYPDTNFKTTDFHIPLSILGLLLFMKIYNHQKWMSKYKYWFYIFYPIHLTFIYILSNIF